MDLQVRIGPDDFDLAAMHAELLEVATAAGAVVTFTGVVRPGDDSRPVLALELEHYPGMTEASVRAVAEEAAARWPLEAVRVVHRVGRLMPGEQIVAVLAASSHRQAAFQAATFMMDYLKTRAVFWKREVHADGARWVESREDDHTAAARWQQP